MTNWLTLHEPGIPDCAAPSFAPAPGPAFHLRADIITEIVPGAGETLVRTSNGGQYVCAETADQVLEMVRGLPGELMR